MGTGYNNPSSTEINYDIIIFNLSALFFGVSIYNINLLIEE